MALGRDHCTIFLTLLAIYYYTNLTSLLTFSIIESFKFYSIKLLWMIQKERLLSISLRPLKLQVMWDQRDKFSVVLLPVLWKVISGGFSGSEKTYSSCVIFHNKILSEILINVSVPVTVVTALALCRAPGDPPRGRGRRVAALALAGMWPPARPADTEGRNHHHRGKSPGSWIWCGLEPMSFCIWISFSSSISAGLGLPDTQFIQSCISCHTWTFLTDFCCSSVHPQGPEAPGPLMPDSPIQPVMLAGTLLEDVWQAFYKRSLGNNPVFGRLLPLVASSVGSIGRWGPSVLPVVLRAAPWAAEA